MMYFAGSSLAPLLVDFSIPKFIPTLPPYKTYHSFKSRSFFCVLYIEYFYSRIPSAKHRNLYYNVATKLLVVIAITCVFAAALTLITFPSSTGMIQDIFAQITPASLGNDSGNSTIITNTNNIDQLSTLTSNVTNSSSIVQLATLSSYQPITPSSNSGGSSSDDDEAPSNDDDDEQDESQDINNSDGGDESSNYDNDDNNSEDDSDNDNGNTITITSTGNYDSEDDDDNSDYNENDESENDGYYDDNEDTSDISIGSGGAFASAGGSGAFASVG